MEIHNLVDAYADGVHKTSNATVEKDIFVPSSIGNSSTKFSRIIQISYDLKVVAEVFGLHHNVEVIVPITIGTVPINFNNQDISSYTPVTTPVTTMPAFTPPLIPLGLRKL